MLFALQQQLAESVIEVQRVAGGAANREKVGRNEPCPCGSRRKYKGCCLARDEAGPRAPRSVEIRPPRLTDEDALMGASFALQDLLDADPDLARVGLDQERVVALHREVRLSDGSADVTIDVVRRAMTQAEGPRIAQRLRRALLGAVERYGGSPRELGLVAFGLALVRMEAHRGSGPSPLGAMLVARALGDRANLHVTLLELLGENLDAAEIERLRAEDPARLAKLLATLSSAGDTHYEALLHDLCFHIERHGTPVALPAVTSLPLLVHSAVSVAAGHTPGKLAPIPASVLEMMANPLAEDVRLYAEQVIQWLREQGPTAQPEEQRLAEALSVALARGSLRELVPSLLAHQRSTGTMTFTGEDEVGLWSKERGELFTTDWLEAYGDLLDTAGWPELAQRTRSLRELHEARGA